MKKPSILITNDDGIHATGIKHLWNALKDIAHLTIVAPSKEQSAVGLSITIRDPLRIEKHEAFGNTLAYSVTGTPADSVKLALSVLLENPPDLVVSGINRGSNAGRNMLYSGTVAGAIEGTIRNIPAIAFSCHDFDQPDYHIAEKYIPNIVNHVLRSPLPTGTLLNVNFPAKHHDIKGFKLARQGKRYWLEDPEKRLHPEGSQHYYWLGAKLAEFDEHEESDINFLDQGYIAAVPIHVGELTDHHLFQSRKSEFEKIFEW